jgi:Family of unknown function (DUF6529)
MVPPSPGYAALVEDLVEEVARGNVTEVKVVLAWVIAALAIYQLVLIAVGYGKVRPRFLAARPAAAAHRASGDAIVVLVAVVATMCVSYFGFESEDGKTLHIVAAIALLAVLALKIAVLRWWHGLGRFLPLLGLTVFVLIGLTWASSAGDILADT